jgi:hypothetical protein
MGRLAIIEDDSCPANSVAAASRQVQTSPDKSESKTTTTKTISPAAETATGSGTTKNGTPNQEVSTSSGNQRCCKKKSQGGAGSDESGYYEGDELQGDDSIEIVYDRCLAKNSDRIRIHQNTVSTMKTSTGLHQHVVPSSTTGGVSITPIPVSNLSSVHKPTSSSHLTQGKITLKMNEKKSKKE